MRRSIAKRIAIVGAAALTLGLAACGNGAETPAPTGDPAPTTESEEPAPEPGADPVQIEYLHRLPDGQGMVPVNEIVARWNAENPGIQVSATKFDGVAAEMIMKLEADVNANNAACLAQLGYAEVPEMYVKGLVEDVMSELVEANNRLNADFSYIPGFSSVGPKMNEAAAAAGAGTGTVADVFVAAQDASIAVLKDQGLPVAE